MAKNTRKNSKFHRGFTLLETLIVVGIVAVLASVSITSILVVRKNIQYKQCNDNAYAIYMAAQTNLTQMRSMGELPLLEAASGSDHDAAFGGNCVYTFSKGTSSSCNLIVPATLDAHVRNQQVILEYHPKTGIVYAVFYYEGPDSLQALYESHSTLREDAELRKDLQIGYYTVGDVDAINSEEFTLYQISADISYRNADEGILTVSIPVKDQKGFDIFTNVDAYSYLASRLEILLTVSGQNGGQFSRIYQIMDQSGTPILNFSRDQAQYKIHVELPLDSLSSSFMDLGLELIDGNLQNPIAAGENISVTADISFSPAVDDPIIIINRATITDINPMYHGLTANPDYDPSRTDIPPYILTISNGRHLQNLKYLDEDFAKNIASVQFVRENEENTDFVLDWYENVNFTPISLSGIPKIDGDGVKIQNLTIHASSGVMIDGNTKRLAGLFGRLSDTTISNITLVDADLCTTDAIVTSSTPPSPATNMQAVWWVQLRDPSSGTAPSAQRFPAVTISLPMWAV